MSNLFASVVLKSPLIPSHCLLWAETDHNHGQAAAERSAISRGAGHPSSPQVGMSIPCEMQRETAPGPQVPAALRSWLCCSPPHSAPQIPASSCSAPASPLVARQAASAQGPSVLPGAQPSVRQQQSCCTHLSAPGEQCAGLFSIYLGLSTVSGSKLVAPVSYARLSLSLGTMLGSGRRPDHCQELPPPSLELCRHP